MRIQRFFTDTVKNIVDQVELVRRAKIIILNEASNMTINGFFAENSDIIVLGGLGGGHFLENPRPAHIYYDSVKRGNKYYHISYSASIDDMLNLIKKV